MPFFLTGFEFPGFVSQAVDSERIKGSAFFWRLFRQTNLVENLSDTTLQTNRYAQPINGLIKTTYESIQLKIIVSDK